MKRNLIALVFVVFVFTSLVSAAEDTTRCRNWFSKDFPATAKKAEIVPSPVPGICEIRSGLNILYYAPPAEGKNRGFLIVGEIYTPSGKNLTLVAREALVEKTLSEIDLSRAIKIGHGPVRVVEFTDPDCPFCKRLEKFFAKYREISDRVTRYVFLYPLTRIHPEAEKKAKWILCQKDSAKALEDVMTGNSTVSEFDLPKGCNLQAVSEHLAAARKAAEKLGVRGTPFLIVGKTVVSGLNPGLILAGINRELRKERRY